MTKPDLDIPLAFLRECFTLDQSGAPVWRTRPRDGADAKVVPFSRRQGRQ
jgi:hypothetical protein